MTALSYLILPIQKLQNDSQSLIEWYYNNYLKPNPDKWHLLLSGKGEDNFIKIGNECIYNSTDEKILGVYFDNKLNFNTHLKKLCNKASQKLHALARVSTLELQTKKKYHGCFLFNPALMDVP